ncbi:MAG: type II toxin-antitoxin system Phd/YefM family antitoxin, partial [Calditrichaeota bacterium]
MKNIWPLHDARNRLSEVVDQAIRRGPQKILRRGKEVAVILSIQEYHRLKAK